MRISAALLLLWSCGDRSDTPATTSCFEAAEGDPVPLTGIVLGDAHGCGLKQDSTVRCWGAGGPEHVSPRQTAQAAPPAGAFRSLVASRDGTCGIRVDGVAICWGEAPIPPAGERFAELAFFANYGCGITDPEGSIVCWGYGQDMSSLEPPPGRFVDLVLGVVHGCALAEDGTITCWGAETENRGQATPPPGIFNELYAGWFDTCALDAAGAISCWGSGYPGPPPSGGQFTALDISAGVGCALAFDGSIQCWGDPAFLPTAFSSQYSSPPTGTFTEIAGGSGFACAVRTDGELVCWGRGESAAPCTRDLPECGQSIPPKEVIEVCVPSQPLSRESVVSAGHASTCRLDDAGQIVCWGAGATSVGCGESDCGGTDVCSLIVECGQSIAPSGSFERLALGPLSACALAQDGTPTCWGSDLYGPMPAGAFASMPDWFDHGCGLRPDGRVTCWGQNEHGQAWPPPGRFLEIAPGGEFTCAIAEDSAIQCWGLMMMDVDPIPAGAFSNLRAGGFFACAMSEDQHVHCWRMKQGPKAVAPDVPFAQYDVGDSHACGVRADDGTILCWPDMTAREPLGKTAPPPGSFLSVSAGSGHSCAIATDGALLCWGDNRYGQALPPAP